jgi:hypothetical protein
MVAMTYSSSSQLGAGGFRVAVTGAESSSAGCAAVARVVASARASQAAAAAGRCFWADVTGASADWSVDDVATPTAIKTTATAATVAHTIAHVVRSPQNAAKP